MSATNKYVDAHGMPIPFTAKERRRLARLEADAAIRPARQRTAAPASTALAVKPDDTYHCCYCKQKKTGRFTRGKFATGHGWSQHMTTPVWACWDCLPLGEGRGEEGAQR